MSAEAVTYKVTARAKRTDGGAAITSGRENESVAREGQRTRLGEKTAERKESFFRKTEVTAEAVSYKAKAESKSAGKRPAPLR